MNRHLTTALLFFFLAACTSSRQGMLYSAAPLSPPSLGGEDVVRSTYELYVDELDESYRLTDVLGPRAIRLRGGARVVQLRFVRLASEVSLDTSSVVLQVGDREFSPLSPAEVADLVSLPVDLTPVRPTRPPEDPEGKLTGTAVEQWLEISRSEGYRDRAFEDIEEKLTLDSVPATGDPRDTLLVFLPDGAPAGDRASHLLVKVVQGGRIQPYKLRLRD